MATTVHIPADLLAALDHRAAELGTSRNRLIVRAVEQSLRDETAWPSGFFERFSSVTTEQVAAVEEMWQGIVQNRRSKPPVKL